MNKILFFWLINCCLFTTAQAKSINYLNYFIQKKEDKSSLTWSKISKIPQVKWSNNKPLLETGDGDAFYFMRGDVLDTHTIDIHGTKNQPIDMILIATAENVSQQKNFWKLTDFVDLHDLTKLKLGCSIENGSFLNDIYYKWQKKG